MKITIIGAGSSYTPELIEGFIERSKNVQIDELHLVDCPDGEYKLNTIFGLTERMIKKVGLKTKLYKHLDYKDAIPGSDFVMCQIRVGFLEARALDERIPGKYGMLGQETNGAGGLFKGIRTVPVILDIVDEVKKTAPDAWIINFSNPSGLIAEAVHRLKNFDRFIGLCNVPIGMERYFNDLMEEDYTYEFMGLNHFVFLTQALKDNYNYTQKLIETVNSGKSAAIVKNIVEEKWEPEFLRQLGAIPCSYLQYYYKKEFTNAKFMKDWETGTTRAEKVMALEEELFKKYNDVNLDVKPKELEERGGAFYSTAACSLVESIITNDGATHVINYKNNGAIVDLPNDVACEYSARIIDGKVVCALTNNKLPKLVVGDVLKMKDYEIAVVNGIKNNSYNELLGALMINPLSTDDVKVKAMFDELYDAHKKYINFERPSEQPLSINQTFDNLQYIEGLNIPIFMYHRFTNDLSKVDDWTLPIELFESQILTIKECGFTFITMDNLYNYFVNKQPIPEKSILMTFDDGNEEMESIVLPLLYKHNMVASMFIVGAKLGVVDTKKKRSYISREQLETLRKSNMVELGHHTYNFHDGELGNVITNKTTEEIIQDEWNNRQFLNRPNYFCFPYGLYNDHVLETLQSVGIKMGFSTIEGFANASQNIMELNRFNAGPELSPEKLKELLSQI